MNKIYPALIEKSEHNITLLLENGEKRVLKPGCRMKIWIDDRQLMKVAGEPFQVAFSRYEMEDLRREYDLILKEAGTTTFRIPRDISEQDLWDLMVLAFFSAKRDGYPSTQ